MRGRFFLLSPRCLARSISVLPHGEPGIALRTSPRVRQRRALRRIMRARRPLSRTGSACLIQFILTSRWERRDGGATGTARGPHAEGASFAPREPEAASSGLACGSPPARCLPGGNLDIPGRTAPFQAKRDHLALVSWNSLLSFSTDTKRLKPPYFLEARSDSGTSCLSSWPPSSGSA